MKTLKKYCRNQYLPSKISILIQKTDAFKCIINEKGKNRGRSDSDTGTAYLGVLGHRLNKSNQEGIFSLCTDIDILVNVFLGSHPSLESSGIQY